MIKRLVARFHSRDGQEYSDLSGNSFDSSWLRGIRPAKDRSLLHSTPGQSFGGESLGFCKLLALGDAVSLSLHLRSSLFSFVRGFSFKLPAPLLLEGTSSEWNVSCNRFCKP